MTDNRQITLRLKRIEGQVRGILRMIEEKQGCEKVLQQLSAARSALYRVGTSYISMNMEECLKEEIECSPETGEKIRDLILMLSKFS